MSQSNQNKLSNKVIEKTISVSIKKEIAAANINTTTRKGNKELKFLTSKIAQYPFNNIEQAQIAGTKLGQHLAAIFQQRGKHNLDGGLIQQVYHQKGLLSLAGLSDEEQTSNEVLPTENLTSSNLEQPTVETQPTDEVVDNGTTSTTEEKVEADIEESTPEIRDNDELSLAKPTVEIQATDEVVDNNTTSTTEEKVEADIAESTP